MGLFILGGLARAMTLDVPKGSVVRPTSVVLRRKLFDAHQYLSEYIFIDICAGTGAIGLEAWSRGASQVILIEVDGRTYRCLNSNIKKLARKFAEQFIQRRILSYKISAQSWLQKLQAQYVSWDDVRQKNTILFIDPPYQKHDLYHQLVSLDLREWYSGQIWIESDRQKGLKLEHWEEWGKQFLKTYVQGTSYVAILDLR